MRGAWGLFVLRRTTETFSLEQRRAERVTADRAAPLLCSRSFAAENALEQFRGPGHGVLADVRFFLRDKREQPADGPVGNVLIEVGLHGRDERNLVVARGQIGVVTGGAYLAQALLNDGLEGRAQLRAC